MPVENPLVVEAENVVRQRTKLLRDTENELRAAMVAEWVRLGGCTSCWGRGWVVVWDTMDCMDGSCADYGQCTRFGCTQGSRLTSGLCPKELSKYDHNRGIPDVFLTSSGYINVVLPLLNAIRAAELARDMLKYQFTLKKGSRVKVVKGRKVPQGTEGTVFWMGSSAWGQRVGFKDAKEAVHWISADNVMVL